MILILRVLLVDMHGGQSKGGCNGWRREGSTVAWPQLKLRFFECCWIIKESNVQCNCKPVHLSKKRMPCHAIRVHFKLFDRSIHRMQNLPFVFIPTKDARYD